MIDKSLVTKSILNMAYFVDIFDVCFINTQVIETV